jgi:hypothetical protein
MYIALPGRAGRHEKYVIAASPLVAPGQEQGSASYNVQISWGKCGNTSSTAYAMQCIFAAPFS